MAKQEICRIELTPAAKRALEGFCEKTGTTQVSTMSRMTEWFAGQSELIQAAILRQYPKEIEAEIVSLILKKLPGRSNSRQAG